MPEKKQVDPYRHPTRRRNLRFFLGQPEELDFRDRRGAAICREMGLPLRFPGPEKTYRSLYQVTSADLLARANDLGRLRYRVTVKEQLRATKTEQRLLFGSDLGEADRLEHPRCRRQSVHLSDKCRGGFIPSNFRQVRHALL